MSQHVDITIIGSGPGGYRAAVLAALQGASVAIVEKSIWGGCCLNRGCVPKKTWHHTAQVLASQATFANRGLDGVLSINPDKAWQHQASVVATVRESYLNYLQRLKVKRYVGHASLISANEIEVVQRDKTPETIHSDFAILATGSKPLYPAFVTPDSGRVITTDQLFEQQFPPGKRVAILGGGVIGTEFAFILKQFGFEISWLTRQQPLSRSHFSPQALSLLKSRLQNCGIAPELNRTLSAVDNRADGLGLIFDDGSEKVVDWMLLATGRTPNTIDLGLENTRIARDENGFIQRNEYLQTAENNIFAIGDCASPEMTANHALADAGVAIYNILRPERMRESSAWIPQSVYSAIEMSRIGLNEDQAEDKGFEPAIGFSSFETSPSALGEDDNSGFVRLVAELDSQALLGAEIVGANASELIHLVSDADHPDAQLKSILSHRYSHPTRMEEMLNAVDTMISKWGMGELRDVD